MVGSLATTTMLATTIQHGTAPRLAGVLVISPLLFALGTMLPILAGGFSYFAQQQFTTDLTRRYGVPSAVGLRWSRAAIWSLCGSAACFAVGVLWIIFKLPNALSP